MKKMRFIPIFIVSLSLVMGSTLISRPVSAAWVTFVVNSTGDEPDKNIYDTECLTNAGTCTFRAAIQQANYDAGPADTITFNITEGLLADKVIYIGSQLPTIMYPANIQGPNAGGGAIILDGKGTTSHGLVISGDSSTVSNIKIRNFDIIGIYINEGNNVTVSDCVIGSTTGSSMFPGNGAKGIAVYRSSGVSILDNLISGNGGKPGTGGEGISIQEGGSNIIQGNLIGTDITGSIARPNIGPGINIANSDNNLIGGTSPDDRNLISGNGGNGILISTYSAGNIIKGNYIGTNLAGT